MNNMNNMNPVKNVVIYCRQSMPSKNMQNLSLHNQKQICIDYCKLNNYNVLYVVEEIVSAKNMSKMHNLMEMIQKLQNDVDIIVSDVSRFSRNMTESLQILEQLRHKKIFVHAVINNCVYNDISINRLNFRAYLNQAEYESSQISMRTKMSLQFRKNNGSKIGKPAFGYECYYDENGIRHEKLNIDEQHIIDIINDKHNTMSLKDIASNLNNMGYDFRGLPWTASRICYVFSLKKKRDNVDIDNQQKRRRL